MNTGIVKFYNGQKGFGSASRTVAARTYLSTPQLWSAPVWAVSTRVRRVSFDTQEDHRTGKLAVGNIQAA